MNMDKPSKNRQEEPCESCDRKPSEDRARDDFNEEQMLTDTEGSPVETDPVKPRDKFQPAHIPGVASS
jgi:hypothetical protein